MTLLSFQIAARIGRLSSRADLPNLPTPYQLCLLLGFYTGSLSSLWRWMKHIVSKPRENVVRFVSSTAALLIIASGLG
jgi:hypothetical protein